MNKLQGNRAYIKTDHDPAVSGFNSMDISNDQAITRPVRIEVYKGNKYQGKKIFSQSRIIIGKSLEADLVLSDDEISDRHACITYIDEQLVIVDQTQKTGLLIRGGLYGISIIDSSEQVGIGPYILNITHGKATVEQNSDQPHSYDNNLNKETDAVHKDDFPGDSENRQVNSLKHDSEYGDPDIKNEKSDPDLFSSFEDRAVEDPELYDLVFEGNIRENLDLKKVKRNLARILKTDKYRIEHFLSLKRVVIKSGLEIDTAKKYKKYFEKSGALCRLTVHSSTDRHSLPIQEEEPESSAAEIPVQSLSEVADELAYQTRQEKPDTDIESQIETHCLSGNDGEAIDALTLHTNIDTSSESQAQLQESVQPIKEESAGPADEKIPDDDILSKIPHYSTELPYKAKSETGEKDIKSSEEGRASVKEPAIAAKAEQSGALPKGEKPVWKYFGINVDDEYDEEEDLPADFLLKDKINDLNAADSRKKLSNGSYLEVIKLRGDDLIDIKHLEEKEKYFISNDRGKRFCLAEVKGSNEALFSFNKKLQGNLETEGREPVETSLLMNDENCISKRKGVYRTKIPSRGKVLISDGYFDYQMRVVNQSLVQQTPEIKEIQKKSYRHIGVSFAFHIVFLLFLGLFPSFDNGEKATEETRFVKLDSTQLAELEKVMNPQPKPPAPKPPAVKQEVKKETAPTVPTKKPVKISSSSKPSKSKTTKSRPSRHPDAGGGFGEGNVATRNINETGILGMISDSVGIQPRNALAAVTNLDAVSSPNVKASNLTVSGVVGKLGTGEIAVPKGTIVSTKGSTQVLRSYGRKGEGTVAALEKGKIGEQEVMGMVTATLDKSARIRGGLSMEAVKRVIDAHLDDITYCYETELIANPSIVGKVMFEWKILMSGEVGEVRIKSSSVNSHEIHTCIKDAIRTWRFPKPSGSEVIVSYPFVFDIVGF